MDEGVVNGDDHPVLAFQSGPAVGSSKSSTFEIAATVDRLFAQENDLRPSRTFVV
jgi:hypothetical protein